MHASLTASVLGCALALWAPPAPPAPVGPERPTHTVALEPGVMLFVKAELAGRTLTFLVDTGASQNVLDRGMAAELGIEGHGKLPAMGVGSQMIELARVERLRVGDWTGEGVMFSLMDLGAVRRAMEGFAGILGIPFLGEFKWVEWSLDGRTLTLAEYLPDEPRPVNPIEKMLGGGVERLFERFKQRADRPSAPAAASASAGVTLAPAADGLRAHFGLGADVGLVVQAVVADGAGAAAGLAAGDLVTHIDGEPARSPDALDARLRDLGPGAVTVAGFRKGRPFSVRVRTP